MEHTLTLVRDPQNPINGRIQQFLERMHRMRVEMIDEINRKRPAPVEPTDGLDQAKRQRVAAAAPSAVTKDPVPIAPPLPAGPISWRQLFTLNPEGSTVNFDVQAFRDPDMLVRILVPVLQSVDQVKMGHALNVRLPAIHRPYLLPLPRRIVCGCDLVGCYTSRYPRLATAITVASGMHANLPETPTNVKPDCSLSIPESKPSYSRCSTCGS
jgi:hypothetical protein